MTLEDCCRVAEAALRSREPAAAAPFALTDRAYVDFSPTAEFDPVIAHPTGA